ncbi:unnamed protein product [Linum tenue]|uniref:RIN4 pathogenic type III effector avirulence factor Avr cleavage site domain-containing protein n=1 Tax=Linum tenue TaxID=586396 RepID=A0AAV0L0E5_9ROSI|nr:unnamed protein product [Linum tenue]
MAQQRSHVPKFGNWESEEQVPYTQYFDKARKGRTDGKMINPNDPMENPDLLPASKVVKVEPVKQGVGSPARPDNGTRRAGQGGGRGGGAAAVSRPARNSAGSDNSFERSPLHPHARISGGRASGAPSPVWEGKSSHESSHGTPGRSRLRPKGDESPDKGAAVPKFGDWDENNPASADGYTHIFNMVREERQGGVAGRGPGGTYGDSSHGNARKHNSGETTLCHCFPWGRK